MTTKNRSPWRMMAPLAIVITLFAIWSAYWLVASQMVQTQAADQRAKLLDAKGITLKCQTENWGGYPFRFEFTCLAPAVILPDGNKVRSGLLFAAAQAYNPMHIVALLDGPTMLEQSGGAVIQLSHDQARLSIVLNRDGKLRISADIPKVDAAGQFIAESLQIHTRPTEEEKQDVAIVIEKAIYRSTGKPPLNVDRAQLLGTLTGPRDLAVTDIQFQQDKLKLWGAGNVSLDEANRIAGRITSQTNDLNRLLAVLDPHIKATDQERATIRAILGLLGQQAKVDIVALNGELFIGPIKIADLLPIY